MRLIYYWAVASEQIRMLYVYPKRRQEDLTPAQLDALRGVIESWDDE